MGMRGVLFLGHGHNGYSSSSSLTTYISQMVKYFDNQASPKEWQPIFGEAVKEPNLRKGMGYVGRKMIQTHGKKPIAVLERFTHYTHNDFNAALLHSDDTA